MKKIGIIFLLFAAFLFHSCASLSRYPGVGRIREYTIESDQLPPKFDSLRVAFVSDFHLPSKYKMRHLEHTIRALQAQSPELLLLGGDYQEGCDYVEPLFAALAQVSPPCGTFAVLGNNDYERCITEIRQSMERHNITLLEHRNDTIFRGEEYIIISGVRNPFDLKCNGISPTLALQPKDYVILLTHTPDYAEDTDISNTDLVLAGHTHGGQITLFSRIVPQTGSKYGRRFLTGLKETRQGIPIIITNGLGTSRIPVRTGARSEIVIITLVRK